MTNISPQFGTLHPNMQKAFDAQQSKGNKPATMAEIKNSTAGMEYDAFNNFLSSISNANEGIESLGGLFTSMDKYSRSETAGTLLELASNPKLFPTEIPQEAQQILFNHFTGEDDLQKPTVDFNA